MKLSSFDERIHSVIIVTMTLISIFFFFFVKNIGALIPLFLFLNFVFFINGLKLKKWGQVLIVSILFSAFCTFLPLFFPNPLLDVPPYLTILFFKIPRNIFEIQKLIFYRLILLSSISMGMIYVVNFEKVIIFFMRHKILSAKWGYSLLLAFNSIGSMNAEIEKIQINAQFRNIPFLERMNLIFPLLVYAIRHADRGSMALVTRGLSEDKDFYFDTFIRNADKKISILFLFVIIFTVVMIFI